MLERPWQKRVERRTGAAMGVAVPAAPCGAVAGRFGFRPRKVPPAQGLPATRFSAWLGRCPRSCAREMARGWWWRRRVLPCLVLSLLPWFSAALLETDGGWATNRHAALTEEDRCIVERRDATLTYSQFIQQYAFSRPVILQGVTDNSDFQAQCTKGNLLARFGERLVRLSTANTYSYRKVDLPFQEYVGRFLEPQDLHSLGSETLYFFGDNNFTEWAPLFQTYRPPPFQIPGTTGAYSFGIAGPGSGVPFHWHGPGYSEVIFGRKRWFLYPPEKRPDFHPNRTTLSWLLDTYPFLPPEERPLECTIRPGEILYFPDRWWHATLNLDTSVFISTFLG